MIKAAFKPRLDITAFEVAYVVAHLHSITVPPMNAVRFTVEQWESLPADIVRHFERIE